MEENEESSFLVGSLSFNIRYAVSSKVDFSKRSLMEYPRYLSEPSEQPYAIPVTQTATPKSPIGANFDTDMKQREPQRVLTLVEEVVCLEKRSAVH